MDVVINIMNDTINRGNRNFQKLTSFMSIFDKVPKDIPVNVFGGEMNFPRANYTETGTYKEKSCLLKLLRYTKNNFSPDSLMIILESDVCVCVDFVKYVMEMDAICPTPDAFRSGYSALDASVLAFENAVLSRSRFWFTVPTDEHWGTPCVWGKVGQWTDYFQFLLNYDNNKFRLDTALKDFMIKNSANFISILIPNPVLHIGSSSAVFKSGDLGGESRKHTGRRQTVSYLEDPFAI